MTDAADRNPFNVRCGKCSHVWTAAWLPMEASVFAKLAGRLHCPNCGNGPKQLFAAPSQPVTSPTKESPTWPR